MFQPLEHQHLCASASLNCVHMILSWKQCVAAAVGTPGDMWWYRAVTVPGRGVPAAASATDRCCSGVRVHQDRLYLV